MGISAGIWMALPWLQRQGIYPDFAQAHTSHSPASASDSLAALAHSSAESEEAPTLHLSQTNASTGSLEAATPFENSRDKENAPVSAYPIYPLLSESREPVETPEQRKHLAATRANSSEGKRLQQEPLLTQKEEAFSKQKPERKFPELYSLENEFVFNRATRSPGLIYQPFPESPRNALSWIGGVNLSQGFQNGLPNRATFTGFPVVGLGYRRMLAPRWDLNLGLFYQARGGLNSDTTVVSRYLGFGGREETESLEINSLHYLEVPISVSYYLRGRHRVQAGAYMAYLLGARATLRQQVIENGRLISERSSKVYGIRQGFNAWDYGLMLGYGFQANKQLRIGTQLYWGMADVSENSFFENVQMDRNLQLRVSLSYDLWKW